MKQPKYLDLVNINYMKLIHLGNSRFQMLKIQLILYGDHQKREDLIILVKSVSISFLLKTDIFSIIIFDNINI